MSFEPLLSAKPPIPYHAIVAIVAAILGAIQLWLAKGTSLHRWLGYLWVMLMLFVALSGLFIYEIRVLGPFSHIHLLSFLVLVSLWFAVQAARRGNIRRHKRAMTSLFWLALVLTGAFTFLPGRVMHQLASNMLG
ncbi:MAG: DUF2306 domain-containing protein [Gammaproteobacteria bacterium]